MMQIDSNNEIEIKEISTFQHFLKNGITLKNCTIQNLDFSQITINWENIEIENTTFLGCHLNIDDEVKLRRKGAYIYIHPTNSPYNPYRNSLYNWKELMEGFDPQNDQSIDIKIYNHFSKSKFRPTINEALCQRIHDHAMDEGVRNFIGIDGQGMTQKKCVGFMGGHSTQRTDEFYKKTAQAAKLLSENGYLVVSGGGPGIMEATNLGAYFAGKSDSDLNWAIKKLTESPHYSNSDFHQKAFDVLDKYPEGGESLAIPTWFYGHEPSNLFASHIAKYFSNSIREDTLLAICLFGLVCSPGSAGTTQEIFQDATQNHYGTFNYYSPMVFLGKKRYEIDTMIYPLLRQLSYGRKYHDLLAITDEPKEVLEFLLKNPPILVKD